MYNKGGDIMTKRYNVWVGGVEVNNYEMTLEKAEDLAQEYIDDGYHTTIVEA